MNKEALLIIDVQLAMFMCDGGVYKGEETLANIKTLLERAREKETPVIFVQHTVDYDSPYKRGTETWNIHPKIAPRENEVVVAKTKCDSFFKTNLEEVLKEKAIEKLTIVGMQTEFCVDTTIRAAFSKEYKNTFVRGCHTTFDTEVLKAEDIIKHHERTWGSFGELKNLEDITF